MHIVKYVKNRDFWPIFGENTHFSRISGPIPRISEGQKSTKNADEVSGFLRYFSRKSQYMGPPKPPKTVILVCFAYPPKIIKNRLNFACSKIPLKTVFFYQFGTPNITFNILKIGGLTPKPYPIFHKNCVL